MKPEDRDRDNLEYIYEAIEEIFYCLGPKPRESFFNDRLVELAVTRLLHTMAESTQRLSSEAKQRCPDIDFTGLANFRNILVHGYLGSINLELVWDAIENKLPSLKHGIEQAYRDMYGKAIEH